MPGGSGGGQSSQTVTQTNLPEYARPYFERLMNKAEATSNEDYQPYIGQRLAGFTPDTIRAQYGIRGLASYGTPGMNRGMGYAGEATRGALNAGDVYDPRQGEYGELMAGYMNPYIQNVIEAQKSAAGLDYARQRSGRNADYVKAGAFGGSRQAVQEALGEEALMNRMSGIEATGLNTAWDQANQSAQFLANLGLQGYGTAMQGAGLMSDIDRARYAQRQSQMKDLAAIGQDWQNLAQTGLDIRYEDFLNQRDYPRQSLGWLSGILRGVPVTPSQSTSQYQFRSPYSQLLGSGLSGMALSQLFGGEGAQ